mgnify:FL=1|jgi:hypothetical protein
MGVTVTQLGRNQVSGSRITATLKVTFDASYTTGGGDDLNLTQYVPKIESVLIDPSAATGHVFQYDRTNAKIKAFIQKAPADSGSADIPLTEVTGVGPIAALDGEIVYITVTGTRA